MARRSARLLSTLLNEVPLWPLVALIFSLGGWHLLSQYVKWHNPGGSALPLGLPAALLLFGLSSALAVVAVRRRRTAGVILAAIVPIAIALGGVAYVVLFIING
jgi:hypothetical protein